MLRSAETALGIWYDSLPQTRAKPKQEDSDGSPYCTGRSTKVTYCMVGSSTECGLGGCQWDWGRINRASAVHKMSRSVSRSGLNKFGAHRTRTEAREQVPTIRTGRIGPHAKVSRTSGLRLRQIKRKIRQTFLGEAAPRS